MDTCSCRNLVLALALCLVLTVVAGLGQAQIAYSPDIAVDLGGTVVADEQVADDDFAGPILLANLGAIPEAAEVDAYDRDGNDHLFSLDTATQLAGGLTVVPADVVRYDGATYTLALNAISEGLPPDADVDAVSVYGQGLVVSFDTTVDLGGGLVAADEDLVVYTGGTFVALFDGSAAGVDPSLDLDAVSMTASGAFYASFDQAGVVGGVLFDDDSIVLYSGSSWSGAGDLSAAYPSFASADLVAVPEPEFGPSLVTGVLALIAAAQLRRPSARPKAPFGGSPP